MGGKLDDLSELSKNLSIPPNHPQPERYIRETLLAHGIFQHAQQVQGLSGANSVSGTENKLAAGGISELDKKRTTQLISQIREGREVHSLKEPPNLFTRLPARPTEEKLPLWPSEVDCISGKPHFQATPPPKREKFYRNDRDVVSPKLRSSEGGGAIVYSNLPTKQKFYTCSRAGPSLSSSKATPPRAPSDTTLIFESRFESGNLGKAIQVGKWDYELYLRFDLYTNKHTQWFYFRVENMRAGQTYRFTIVNLYKAGSLYNNGMQPVMYSEVKARQEGVGWGRAGHAIKYFKTDIRRQDTRQESYYYALTWSHTFQHTNDTVYFAHCFPYTYSDLQHYLHGIQKDPNTAQFVKQRTLCHSIAGNSVPILTITSKVQSPEENRSKKVVVVTSRVHPGETNGSWMMKGLLDFLVSASPDAKILRDTFIFKVIPMLNPDGVIVGNYRCSLSGRDLNRNYRSKLKESYPTVSHIKAMVKKTSESHDVVLYCDLHGHSRKQNIFIYGCDELDDPLTRLRSRIFPKMLSKNAPHLFSYKDSKFGVHKSKEGTGRVVMWREMGITNSYTMEATFCGSLLGKRNGYQFSTTDLEEMGYHFCDTLLDYCDPDQSKVERILDELADEYRAAILSHLLSMGCDPPPPGVDPLDIKLTDFDIDLDSSDGGSDSSVSDGLPVNIVAKEMRKKKKKKLKSRRERDKKKALLKMTHAMSKVEAPPTAPPTNPTSSAFITQSAPAQQPLILTYHHDNAHALTNQRSVGDFSYVPNEVARNGGIPVFIQERLDERQKKRSDAESAEKIPDEVEYPTRSVNVDAITMDFMRQGLPPPALTEVDPRSSTSFLPRPINAGFPMSITSVPLCEGRGPSHPPSRLTSRTALQQLDSAHSNHGLVPFASQYVAHHLREDPGGVATSPQGTSSSSPLPMTAGQNSTRNLANLSRLFRQLRPHLLQNISSHAKQSQKEIEEVRVQGEASLKDIAAQLSPPKVASSKSNLSQQGGLGVAGLPVQGGGATKPVGPTHSQTILAKQVHSRLTLKRSEAMRSNEHLSSSEKISPSVSLISEGSKKDRPIRKSQPTKHDRKVLGDVYPPSNSLLASHRGSPLTSSWESFTRPVKLKERNREEEEVGGAKSDTKVATTMVVGTRGDKGQRSNGDVVPSVQPTSTMQRPMPGQSSDDQLSPPTAPMIEAHKEGVARAVDSVREQRERGRWQHQSKANRHISEIENEIKHRETKEGQYSPHKEDKMATSLSSPSPPTLPTIARSVPSEPVGGASTVGGATVAISSSDEEMRRRLEGLDVDAVKGEAPDNQNMKTFASKKTTPQSTSFIYSSKPPSLYGGPKPSPDCSSRPTTVSIMLSRGSRATPPSSHGHTHNHPSPSRQRKYHSSSQQSSKRKQSKGHRTDLT